MNDKSRAAAARVKKRNNTKKGRQIGGKIVRSAVNAMHAEAAEVAAEAAKDDQDEPEDGDEVD